MGTAVAEGKWNLFLWIHVTGDTKDLYIGISRKFGESIGDINFSWKAVILPEKNTEILGKKIVQKRATLNNLGWKIERSVRIMHAPFTNKVILGELRCFILLTISDQWSEMR